MKIGILTQPLRTNYGGLLQAYALQKVLKDMGHEVWTEDIHYKNVNFFNKIKSFNIVRRLFGKEVLFTPNLEEISIIRTHTDKFIKKNINTTIPIFVGEKFKLRSYQFDAYVVGSDQVWRPCYSPNIYNYFLDFSLNQKVKRIAYAASFGVEEWEFTPEQTKKCKALIQNFDAISVREDTAVNLCKANFGIDAFHVLDPTMLLEQEDYNLLVLNDSKKKGQANIMAYVLDKTPEKLQIISKLSSYFQLEVNSVMPKKLFNDGKCNDILDYVFPPVTDWIKGFMDAKFVVTDSFHGCVFALIYNKPFIAVGNHERGMSRFNSLIKMFDLEDRLVFSQSDVTLDKINSPIDWQRINKIREELKVYSLSFLTNSLN